LRWVPSVGCILPGSFAIINLMSVLFKQQLKTFLSTNARIFWIIENMLTEQQVNHRIL